MGHWVNINDGALHFYVADDVYESLLRWLDAHCTELDKNLEPLNVGHIQPQPSSDSH